MIFRIVITTAVLLSLGSKSLAQETRVGEITRQQAEKAKRLGTEGPTGVERLVTRLTLPTKLVSPWFGSVYRGAGFAAGLTLGHGSVAEAGRIEVIGAFSVRKTPMLDVTWRMQRPDARVHPTLQVRTLRAKGLKFYGLGADADEDQTYELTHHRIRATADVVVGHHMFLTATGGYRGVSTKGLTASANLGTRVDFFEGGVGGRIDWRPAADYATRGGVLRGELTHHRAMNGAPYTYSQASAEFIHLQPVQDELFVLAFRALVSTSFTKNGQSVPVIDLPEVGSGHTVRGFRSGRFRDRSRVVFSGEYRWRPSRVIDMALFVDHGASASALGNLTTDAFVTALGAGIRFHTPTTTVFRFDMARSREGWRAVFGTSQPF
jgi:Omp85 superfamily domain